MNFAAFITVHLTINQLMYENLAARSQPLSFQLTTNYRSHSGIVDCAHTAIELMSTLWPDAIDHLGPERGLIDGSKPIFFTGGDHGNIDRELFSSKPDDPYVGLRF